MSIIWKKVFSFFAFFDIASAHSFVMVYFYQWQDRQCICNLLILFSYVIYLYPIACFLLGHVKFRQLSLFIFSKVNSVNSYLFPIFLLYQWFPTNILISKIYIEHVLHYSEINSSNKKYGIFWDYGKSIAPSLEFSENLI